MKQIHPVEHFQVDDFLKFIINTNDMEPQTGLPRMSTNHFILCPSGFNRVFSSKEGMDFIFT